MRIAVIGTGISGSLVARLLSTRHEVTVFEANDYAGGHANTVDVTLCGKSFPVDTGFMVFNRRTYPNFCRLLELLGIDSQRSDMSFSVRCSNAQLEYQGSSLNGLFAQRRNVWRPSFLRMLRDVMRFNRVGRRAAESGILRDGRTVRQLLAECRVGRKFVDHYLVPMAAAIWSSKPDAILDFPADFLIGFFANHGLMQMRDRPQWLTIPGGSRSYIESLLRPLGERVRLGCPVAAVRRGEDQVHVQPAHGSAESFEHVVFASHADQTLRLLPDATREERQILRCFPYQANQGVLHTDIRLLPRRRRAWASWNYHILPGRQPLASVTYDLSRLQNHDTRVPILLTLNETSSIEPSKVVRTFRYHHPAYSTASIAAQRRWDQISGRHRTHFCGAYWGYGFHEDGARSALRVARHFQLDLEACTAASMKESSRIAVASR